MGRSNTRKSIANWNAVSASASFRASIDGNHSWPSNRVHPDALNPAAERVCRGGRILSAFTSEAVRDLFVDSFLDMGAQVEADGTDTATARQERVIPSVPDLDLADLMERYPVCEKLATAIGDDLEAVFLMDISRAFAAGHDEEAVGIVASIPSESDARFAGIVAMDANGWDRKRTLGSVPVMPYTPERAAAVLSWQRSHREYEGLNRQMSEKALRYGRDLVDQGRRDELVAFTDDFPRSMTKAFLLDLVRQSGLKAEADAGAGPKP